MSKFPPLPIVNEEDEVIGEATLQEILNKGLIHRIVHVLVEDEDGKVLLQKRGPNVATNAGKWDFSAAGYVDLGESYGDAAKRELAEELGLSGRELVQLSLGRSSETHKDFTTHRFVATYKTVVPVDVQVKVDPSEVAEVEWFDQPGLKELLALYADEVTIYTAQWLRENYLSR